MQQNISQVQTDIQFLKDAMTALHNQYAAPLDTNPVALQQNLSKMKAEIKQVQQTRHPNSYPNNPGASRRFRPTDGQIICRCCNNVGDFARSCKTNLAPAKTNIRFPHAQSYAGSYENQRPSHVNHGISQYPQPQYVPNHNPRQNVFRTEKDEKPNTMGYHYPQDYIYTRVPRQPTFQFGNQAMTKYQSGRTNIPSQHTNYSNVVQNHALQEHLHRIKEIATKPPNLIFYH